MKIGNYYIGEEPPEFTAAEARNAKLSRGDRKRKKKAEMNQQLQAAFYNASGKLK